MWRQRLKVPTSKAEDNVHAVLQSRGLTRTMLRNYTVTIGVDHEGRTRYTKPDLCWPWKKLAVYLDGPPHHTDGSKRRDERINEALKVRKWTVLRFGFTPPLRMRSKRCREICDRIARELGAKNPEV